jgi:hypothetical protein
MNERIVPATDHAGGARVRRPPRARATSGDDATPRLRRSGRDRWSRLAEMGVAGRAGPLWFGS